MLFATAAATVRSFADPTFGGFPSRSRHLVTTHDTTCPRPPFLDYQIRILDRIDIWLTIGVVAVGITVTLIVTIPCCAREGMQKYDWFTYSGQLVSILSPTL